MRRPSPSSRARPSSAAAPSPRSRWASDQGAESGGPPARSSWSPTSRSTCPSRWSGSSSRRAAIDLEIRAAGDAGTLTTKLAVTADNPTGDVAFGVDNTFASRALDEDVFDIADVDLPAGAGDFVVPGDDGERLVPVDTGNVCVNVDTAWFAERDLEPPATLDDLTDPAYDGLFVTPSALSSSPGLAFLHDHRRGVRRGAGRPTGRTCSPTTPRSSRAGPTPTTRDFTAGSEDGDRPVVLSYDSSPAFTVPKGGGDSTTARAARHLLPPGGVRRGAGRCRQPRRRPGARRLPAGRGRAGRAAGVDVRLPGPRRRRAPARLGRSTPSSPTDPYVARPGRDRRRTATTGWSSGATW